MRGRRLVVLGLLFCPTAQGAVHTFGFEGVVDAVSYDPSPPLAVQPGDHLVYEYTFDSDALPNGGYTFPGIDASIMLGTNHLSLTTDPYGHRVQITVQDAGSDVFGVSSSVVFPDVNRWGYIGVNLWDHSGTAFNDWRLPNSPPDLSKFPGPETGWGMNIFAAQYGGFDFTVTGTVTRSYEVPEPVTGILALSALLLVGRRSRY